MKLRFESNKFDCVISVDSFEHFPDDKKVINEVYRVLKKNGTLIIYTPCNEGLLANNKSAGLYQSDKNSFMIYCTLLKRYKGINCFKW